MITETERSVVHCDPSQRSLGLEWAELTVSFLRATEARDIERARTMVGPGFTANFPRGRNFPNLDAWLESSKGTYVRIAKRFQRIDVAITGGDSAVVHCSGTLHGERTDGKPLEGYRYIDRFEIKSGLIVDQQVWNDLVP
jgi:hypothetical protein